MATPLHFITSNNDPNTTTSTNTNTNQWSIINPTQSPTNHHYHPILKPGSNPKPRGRKSGNKSQNGHKNKTPQRGVGMAELERLRLLDEQHSSHSTNTISGGNNGAINRSVVTDPRVNPSFHHSNPLSGVPVIRYCLPSQPISDSRLTHRVGIPESASASYYPELPSMPNPSPLDHSILTSFKKKRVIGEETIGFSKGYNGHFGGFDLKNGENYNNQYLGINNGGFSALHTTNTNGSEVVAIHRKWSGTGNVMMEYGFFPGKSEENTIIKLDSNDNTINNYYNKMEDLNLKMGFISDSSSPSPSPSSSSSLSSLTTATTTTSNSSVDLSLKLSTY